MQITQTVYLCARRYEWDDQYHYHVFDHETTLSGYIPISSMEITFDIPDDVNLVAGEIAVLQQQKREILAEAQVKANAIQDRISKLSALTYSESAHG